MPSPYQLVKTALFSVTVPGTVAGAIPRLLNRRDRLRFPVRSRLTRPIGALTVISGITLYLYTAWQFAADGSGTPAPVDEPEELVTGGLYTYVRNPMYVGVLLIVVGQAFLYRSVFILWWTVGCMVGFHNQVTGYEEPHLEEKYGESFEQYCEEVPRWIPQLR
jgi:protein-S-isoprenylcysteine O-methyltransferase Ste14